MPTLSVLGTGRTPVAVLCLLSLVSATCLGQDTRAVTEAERAAHDRMLELLEGIRERTPAVHPYLGDAPLVELEGLIEERGDSVPPKALVHALHRLGLLQLQRRTSTEAVASLRRALEIFETLDVHPQALEIELRYDLATAYLRFGENQNCVAHHSVASCLLPIRDAGVHVEPEGSQKALVELRRLLPLLGGADDEEHGERFKAVRWLINVACMTLGEYPDAVAEELRVDPDVFARSDFPDFPNVAIELELDTFNLAGGVITEDFDQDGDLDILTSTWDTAGEIHYFVNSSDGTFSDRTAAAGLTGFYGGLSMVQTDFDNDGWIDVLVLRGAWSGPAGRTPNSLLRNNGDGTFVDVALLAGMTEHYPTQAGAWADYDLDGDLDLYVANECDLGREQDYPSQLYRNRGDGRFEEIAAKVGADNRRFGKGVAWGDVDLDGRPELFVSNFGSANRLYEVQEAERFVDIASTAGVEEPRDSFATWFWDFDNDGALDLFVSSYPMGSSFERLAMAAASYVDEARDEPPPALYRGDGTGKFESVGRALGIREISFPMGANFGDLDGDGFLDFFLGTGYPSFDGLVPNLMYRNRAGKGFENVTFAGNFGHLQKGHAIAFADLDNDGDEDVFAQMGGAFPGDGFGNALFRNPGFGAQWIELELSGTQANRAAIGARIRLDVGAGEERRSIYRHVKSGGSFGSGSLTQHVGLGDATTVARIEVLWPGSDEPQVWSELKAGQHLRLTQGVEDVEVVAERSFQLGQ